MTKQAKKTRTRKKKKEPGKKRTPRLPTPAAAGLALEPDDRQERETALAPPPILVGVGASAGGLEAFSEILESLPARLDSAVIFVQHLSPQHDSALSALLAARTPLPVVQVADGMRIESNHVYVIPPNVQLDIVDGAFHATPRPHDRSQFTPIDFFFQSLARSAQDAAIAVVLSGNASDGAAGVREIKAMGGITIAQDPATARHDGMPRAAIATGAIDLVLSPQEIAAQLSDPRPQPYLQERAAHGSATPAPGEALLREIFALLRRATGIDFASYKPGTVRRRLLRRMALQRLTDVGAYVRYMRERPAEATALSRDLLIQVTRFFREPESSRVLQAQVLPEIVDERGTHPVRIWVPGCATGEEAYSLAIALAEFTADLSAGGRVQIFGTDVSEAAIDAARAGTYPPAIAADVSAERLGRFFQKTDGGYRVAKNIRDMCIFARHDLTRDPPFSKLDLVVCRNVLIYLDLALQKRLISTFHYALKPEGFLMLGPAETAGTPAPFKVIDKKWRLYRKTATDVARPAGVHPEHRPGAGSGRSFVAEPHRTEGKPVGEEANRIILDAYGPPGVIVDADFQILQFRGRTGPYLEAAAGAPSLNVLKMARSGLLHPLRTALQTARRRQRPVRRERVVVHRNGDWREITLQVVPLAASRGQHFLVLFEEAEPRPARGSTGRATPRGTRRAAPREADKDPRVGDLRRELAASRDCLQSVVQELEAANEELQSANEEILSSNEELQSTNEELDTAKEELQSTNEELNTVNEELHARNEELVRANSDLVNLLASVDFAVVIVDADLRIRRFTPKAEELFNLIPGDVGRRIGQVAPTLRCDNLEPLVRTTIDTLEPRQQEVQNREDRWFSLRLRPYKGVDNRVEGAVIAALDINAAKRYERHLERARDYFRAIVKTVREPLLVLDPDLNVRTANRSFYETFQVSDRDTEGVPLHELGNGQWNIPALRQLLEAVAGGQPAVDFTVEHEFPALGRRRMILNARPLSFDEMTPAILVAIEDTTDAQSRA